MGASIYIAFMAATAAADAHRHARRSLQQELDLRSIGAIDPALVRKHQDDMRFGTYHGPRLWIARTLALIADLAFFYPIDRLLTRLMDRFPRHDTQIALWALAAFCAGGVGGAMLIGQGHLLAGGLLAFPFLTTVAWIGIVILAILSDVENGVLSHWAMAPLDQLSKPDPTFLSKMPDRLRERARRAASIPGARIMVSYLGSDPILYVERRRLFGTERAAIGAWDTLDSYLDSF